MAASEILSKFGTLVTPTISLASIANNAGRISTVIDNTTVRATFGMLYVKVRCGATAPVDRQTVRIYLIRQSAGGTNLRGGVVGATSDLGDSDAAVTVEPINSPLIGSLTGLNAQGTAKDYIDAFPIYDPGPKFSVVVWNNWGTTLDGTAGNHVLQWMPMTEEAQ